MKTFLNAIKKYFADFGTAVAKGDIWCKLSLLVMGAGYWGRKQIVKGILMTALEVIVILFTGMFSINYIKDLNTLGTVQYESVFDPLTLKNTVNDYDNSLLILLYGIIGVLVIVAFIFKQFESCLSASAYERRGRTCQYICRRYKISFQW